MTKKILFLTLFTLIMLSSLHPIENEPVIYLEFKDFSKFLTELQRDRHYRNFMSSSVIEWYENTRLGLKFPKRLDEFEEVLGFSISIKNIATLSGGETGIWLFDIGELELLLITKISESDYLRSSLARSRESFGEGRIDTVTYYFKKDASGNKEIDFAFIEGNLILSNEPDKFELYLKRLLKDSNFTEWKKEDFLGWVDKPLNEDFDILLYLSSESVRNTYFTSYWFYKNQKEIKEWFDRGLITLKKEQKQIEENRIYNIIEGFAFDSLALKKTSQLFPITPRNADLIKIQPVYGEELENEIKRLLHGGKAADSIFLKVEAMKPLCFGNFVKIREGKILPQLEEGIAIIVEKPDKELENLFDRHFPLNLRNNELFLKNMPDFSIDGNILLFSNVKDFFKNRKAIKKDGLSFYSWLNFEGFGEGYKKEIELLKSSERWRSYENRDFFEKNIADLINIASSYIRSVKKEGKLINGKLNEKVIYIIE
ncbi:MAG: hypothetical protein E3J87_11360 [Candidatus Cloacimonadota bacterium]|nr:MAG: hypothetical protein E3J87_11360 [Candidatus Cloacimonadota bacterium]